MKKNKAILLSMVFMFIISSCSTFSFYRVPVTQGNLYDEEDLNKLEIGQTKEQVKFILGTPMIKDAFNSNEFILFAKSSKTSINKLEKIKKGISSQNKRILTIIFIDT